MRRTIALLTAMAMALLVATSVAMAAVITCRYNPIAPDQDTCFGTNLNDTIHGTVGNDEIWAYDGNDLIYGSGGNDRIVGHEGDDRIAGGPGNDAMYGIEGKDTANFYSSPAAITASLATNEATGEGADYMPGIENLVGSKYNDKLTGSSGPNTLRGYEGKDSYYGGLGDDTITAADGNADGIISCGPGYDKVRFDPSLEVPDGDCEKREPS